MIFKRCQQARFILGYKCNNSGGTGTAAAGGEKRDTVDTMSVWIILLLEYNTAECPLKWEGII